MPKVPRPCGTEDHFIKGPIFMKDVPEIIFTQFYNIQEPTFVSNMKYFIDVKPYLPLHSRHDSIDVPIPAKGAKDHL